MKRIAIHASIISILLINNKIQTCHTFPSSASPSSPLYEQVLISVQTSSDRSRRLGWMLKVCKLYEVFGDDDEVDAPCRSRQSRGGVGVVVRRRGVTRPGQTPRRLRCHCQCRHRHRGRQLRSRDAPVGQRPNGVARGGSGSGCSGGGVAADGEGGEHCVSDGRPTTGESAKIGSVLSFDQAAECRSVGWMDG